MSKNLGEMKFEIIVKRSYLLEEDDYAKKLLQLKNVIHVDYIPDESKCDAS